MNKNNKIFVQIASYRDPELGPTIEDCLNKAKNPENLIFGICWQRDETENLDKFKDNPNFRIADYHYSQSEGLGWARAITNSLYKDEEYTLQIDSHHRFVDHWDEIVLEDFNQALEMSKKPVLTTYCTPFDPKKNPDEWEPIPCLMSQYEFSDDKLLMSMPWYIQDYKSRNKVIKARTISGHFYFASGNFVKEVPYDPDIYFGGYTEETTLSLRAFTHGYDFFSPYRMVMWHEYTRSYRPKHWEDHGTKSETKKTSGERDMYAREKTRQLFGTEDQKIDMGVYGLGKERTVRDYEIYGGFDFKNCRIQDYTLKVKEPPNPTNWEEQFIRNSYNFTIDWDIEFFKKSNFEKPKFLTIGILTKSNEEILRKDLLVETNPQQVRLEENSYSLKFESIDKPSKLVMYLYDEEKGWSDRFEKTLNI
jgi:hypothetical protein